jgi:hypothetical protein
LYNGNSLNITIPDEVQEINVDAFRQYYIESLTIGKQVKSIPVYAFPFKVKIENVYYDGTYDDAKSDNFLLNFFSDAAVNVYMRNKSGEYEKTLSKDTKMYTTNGMDESLIFNRFSMGEKTLESILTEFTEKNKGKFKTRFSFENGRQGFIFECSYRGFDKFILQSLVERRISMVFDDMVISFPSSYEYYELTNAWGNDFGFCPKIKPKRNKNGILSKQRDSGDQDIVDKIPTSIKKIESSYFDTVKVWRAEYTGSVNQWLEIEGHEDISRFVDYGIVKCDRAVVQYLNIEHGKLPEGGGYIGGCHLEFSSRIKFEEAANKRKYWEAIEYFQASAIESNYMRHEAMYYGENDEDEVARSIFDYDVFCDTCVDFEAG